MDFSYLLNPKVLWFIGGLVFIIIEVAVPGILFIFFAAGAFLTGAILLVTEISLNTQLIIFLSASIIFLLIFRSGLKKLLFEKQNMVKGNEIDNDIVGQFFTASTDLKPGRTGRMEFRGTQWDCESEEKITKGTKVRIVKKNGLKLFIEPVNENQSNQ